MADSKGQKKIIVVLGPGRSGTSLLMQILEQLGVSMSENLIQPNASNKYGPKEDKEIFDIHSGLIKELGGSPVLPLPDGWLNSDAAVRAKRKLRGLIKERLSKHDVFSLKDPRMNSLLPLWNQIFIALKITPIYLFAIREFKSTAISHIRQYGFSQATVELSWLSRTVDALEYAGTECFFIHYEDWFSSPSLTLDALKGHLRSFGVSLEGEFDLSSLVDKSADRSIYEDVVISNICVRELNCFFRGCRGYNYDRAALMSKIIYCREVMKGFKGWCDIAHKNIFSHYELQKKVQNLRLQLKNYSECEAIEKKSHEELKRIRLAGKETCSTILMIDRVSRIL